MKKFVFSRAVWLAALVVLLAASAQGADYFVAPAGTPEGDGSHARPWDLATALSQPPALKPGDHLWLQGGTYRGGFTSLLAGKSDAPITVRAVPGERVTVDCKPRDERDSGLFLVRGAWTWFWGLEFTCSDPQRVTAQGGSWPSDIRRGGIDVRGSQIKFINLIVHDLANGFGFWGNDQEGEGGEIYGSLVYHNGWKGPDRGHGHAIYGQNRRGTKHIIDNILFNQFAYGVHCYGSEKAFLQGFHLEGNASFNNGALSSPGERSADLFLGGGTPLERVTLVGNATYGGGGMRLGYSDDVRNQGVVAKDNYLAGSVRLTALADAVVTGNTVVAPGTLLHFDSPPGGIRQQQCDRNVYLRTKVEWAAFNLSENGKTRGLSFSEWQMQTGFDGQSSYREGPPQGVKVIVRPNRYEPGRGHVVVYNWDKNDSVEVNLENLLRPGQAFRIVSAQDFYGEPVLRGTYQGRPLRLPMRPVKAVSPIGMPDYPIPVTEPEFGAFVVLPVDEG